MDPSVDGAAGLPRSTRPVEFAFEGCVTPITVVPHADVRSSTGDSDSAPLASDEPSVVPLGGPLEALHVERAFVVHRPGYFERGCFEMSRPAALHGRTGRVSSRRQIQDQKTLAKPCAHRCSRSPVNPVSTRGK